MRINLRNRDTLLTLALILALAILSIAGAIAGAGDDAAPPLDSGSTAPNGAQALFRWLEELGYTVSDEVGDRYAVPEGTDLVFLLEPSGLSAAETDILVDWVEAGGVLVFAGRYFGSTPLLSAFDVERGFAEEPSGTLAPALAILTDPPVLSPVPIEADSYLEVGFDDFVPLAALPEGPVVIVFDRGSGRVVLSAATGPFTNEGLKLPGAGAFVLNLAAEVNRGGQVWFDEWHHGRRPLVRGPAGPGDWLRRTPAGRAVLYTAGVVFIWVALSGRAFGWPVAPDDEKPRRVPLEYITAIAGLNQRAGNRAELLADYRTRLKRSLAARYRLDPDLPDDAFVAALRKYDADVDLEALIRLLADLSKFDIGEPEMVRLASQSAEWLDSKK
jgi:hypothetical protein